MAGISYPVWTQLKENIKIALEAIATEEAAIDPGRNFDVQKDRWRPWIEAQQNIPIVNIMVQNVGPSDGTSKKFYVDEIEVMVDMYVLGKAGETLPADELSALRLDLLTNQVREGLTRLASYDFGIFDPTTGVPLIEKMSSFRLIGYDQEGEQNTGQYAPGRWTFSVRGGYIPTDDNDLPDLTEINIDVKEEDLDVWAVKFEYTP